MTKAKVKEVVPVATAAAPGDAVFALNQLLLKYGDQRYAAGFRRAAERIAQAVGQLDGESKAKLSSALDQLEMELHEAEVRGA